MASRKIQSPGIELNEIDRSQYGKVDNSLPNSPTVFTTGFASKGEDYSLQWIDSKSTLDETYGQPTNEFERYFYDSIYEVLNRGGTCIATKLPYINDAFGKYNYIDFSVELCSMVSSKISVNNEYYTVYEFQNALSSVIDELKNLKNVEHRLTDDFDIGTINQMAYALSSIIQKYLSFENDSEFSDEFQFDTLRHLFDGLSSFINKYIDETDMFALYANDNNLTSYLNIVDKKLRNTVSSYGKMGEMAELDRLLTNETNVQKNTIRIYDITRSQYEQYKDIEHSFISSQNDSHSNDFLGIVPVIVTPANALFFQNMLDFSFIQSNREKFSQLNNFTSMHNANVNNSGISAVSNKLLIPMASIYENVNQNIKEYSYDETIQWTSQESLSRRASMTFPDINYDGPSHFKQDHLKKIGIAVFKAFRDTDNNDKINFSLVENFVGSLDPSARDPITQSSIFIDNVVNSSSQFINVFSNVSQKMLDAASTIAMCEQTAISMGFYKASCRKVISYVKSIMQALTKVLDLASNKNTLPLDIVVDAGMSNIAWIAKQFNHDMTIDVDEKPDIADYASLKFNEANKDVTGWKAVLKKFDDFVKYIRKDCMFIADGLRPFCLDGNVKIVRKTAPQNTVATAVVPKLKYMTNTFDSSYTAGYCNWFYQQDHSSSDYIWMPPSIKAVGVYIYCDTYFQPWSAPAGLTRGVLNDVVDVAFVPNEDEAGKIYNAQWNYAMNYPIDGIVVEGHKTFQSQRTALDRVNVRRLLLYLEKRSVQIARRFVYEGNTPYLRQLFVDTLRPVFEDAVLRDGLREYAIKCDDELNTDQVIENNELRCRIAVKPVKCVDFIVIDLIATRQNADVTEEVLK